MGKKLDNRPDEEHIIVFLQHLRVMLGVSFVLFVLLMLIAPPFSILGILLSIVLGVLLLFAFVHIHRGCNSNFLL